MLTGKTAVITGGSRGIGRAIALRMAAEGAAIALVYAGNDEAARNTGEELAALGVKVALYRCDIADFNLTKTTVEKIIADFGGIDILVNNAGIVRDGLVLSMTEQDFDLVVDTNLKGAFHMIKHTYAHFMRKRAGRIINITSVSGLMGNAGQANYSAAKAGLVGLTKTVAKELAGRGVTCNAIAPGFIQTDMTDALPANVKECAVSNIPLKRMGRAEEVAALAVFLAGEDAAYITGEVIKVDGGLYM